MLNVNVTAYLNYEFLFLFITQSLTVYNTLTRLENLIAQLSESVGFLF